MAPVKRREEGDKGEEERGRKKVDDKEEKERRGRRKEILAIIPQTFLVDGEIILYLRLD